MRASLTAPGAFVRPGAVALSPCHSRASQSANHHKSSGRAYGSSGASHRTSALPELAAAHHVLADGLTYLASSSSPLFDLASEPVALPCSLMKCGDVVYRSTLDTALRGEDTGATVQGVSLVALAAAYLFVPPGPVPALLDLYVFSSLYRKNAKVYTKEDIVLGRALATGGFGTVYLASLIEENGKQTPVVVKKAKDFGEAEVWMNERMSRVGGDHCASFITAFGETSPSIGSPLDNAIWLVWRYEGDNTLFDLMQKREFPYCLEPLLLNRELRVPKGPRRKLVTIKLVMKQLLEALAACHSTGIVHRDVKPQNCIISSLDKKMKLIDLGAAADLRIGINYQPKEYLLDPRYAPPQQYVMSTQTVRPPPAPVAAFLSPVLWGMESPDKFDMYSCGVTMLQMAFPSLRNDNNLIAFNRKLDTKYSFDIRAWRSQEDKKGASKELLEGFEIMDLDDGAPWELLCALMEFDPRKRPSARKALATRLFESEPDPNSSPVIAMLTSATRNMTRAVSATVDGPLRAMLDEAVADGTKKGALTEAQLFEEFGLEQTPDRPSRQASSTIAWWQAREGSFKQRIDQKERAMEAAAAREAGKRPSAPSAPPPSMYAKAKVDPRAKAAALASAVNKAVASEPVALGPPQEPLKGVAAAGGIAGLFGKFGLSLPSAQQKVEQQEEEKEEQKATKQPFSLFNILSGRK